MNALRRPLMPSYHRRNVNASHKLSNLVCQWRSHSQRHQQYHRGRRPLIGNQAPLLSPQQRRHHPSRRRSPHERRVHLSSLCGRPSPTRVQRPRERTNALHRRALRALRRLDLPRRVPPRTRKVCPFRQILSQHLDQSATSPYHNTLPHPLASISV